MKFTTKKFGSIATAAVLAGTMAFMPATALATPVSSTDTGLTKNWVVPSDAQYTDETFNFTLAYTGAEAVGSNGTATPTGLSENNSKTVSLTKDAFSGDGTTKTATKTFAQLFDGIDFSKPGTYSFTLTEQAGTNQNIVYDTNTSYTMKVEVTWATDASGAPTGTTQIASVKAYDATGKKLPNGATFNNTDPNGNLTVSKNVKGTAANTNDEFTFKAELKDKTGAALAGSYKYTKTDASGKTTTGTYKSDDVFTLKSGETFKIENLPQGATYTVTETNAKGYDSTDVTAEGTTTQKTTTGSGTISQDHENDTVAFVNNKGFTAATGITMNTLPFVAVGVVAVAGGAALVISRRRHAGEDF
ncbi:MAG: DUF5979 domain-containing protein [Atopobiaceae bacterium]|nr:DUF5979 domain-containing protein [Atopobiaceae bacterium]